MQAPGFWDDQERAARVSAEHSSLGRRLETFRSLESDVDDLDTLEELAAEDDSIAAELPSNSEPRSMRASPSSRRRACSPATTTAATRW